MDESLLAKTSKCVADRSDTTPSDESALEVDPLSEAKSDLRALSRAVYSIIAACGAWGSLEVRWPIGVEDPELRS